MDYDLTEMNADMVYATVYDMMANPSAYRGKTVRVEGPCYHSYYDVTDKDYFAVIIKDATACCAQGIEFVWDDGSHVYPDEYPANGVDVVVTGTFDTYKEGDSTYAHLVGASVQAAA